MEWEEPRECLECGREFEPRSSGYEFCSFECFLVDQENRKQARLDRIWGLEEKRER